MSKAVPISGNLVLRDANRDDARLVLWLEEICMREYAEAIWGRWRASASVRTLDLTGHQIVECHCRAAGCIATKWASTHLYVSKLYLAPAFRNRGIGVHILRHLHRMASEHAVPLRLEVLTSNPAIRFYLREGFTLDNETAERRSLVMMPAPGLSPPR